MALYLRLSPTDICAADYQAGQPDTLQFRRIRMDPQASFQANLKEVNLNRDQQVEVILTDPVTPVPLSEFQEEDCETLYNYCFIKEGRRKIFYETVPACNIVLLFALDQATCKTIQAQFPSAHFTTALQPLLQHFTTQALATTHHRRTFLHHHDSQLDIAVFEEKRLILLNSYNVQSLSDVAYYTFNIAQITGLDLKEDPFFVTANEQLRQPIIDNLQAFAKKVFPINPQAEFNRHPVASTPDMPYDLIVRLART